MKRRLKFLLLAIVGLPQMVFAWEEVVGYPYLIFDIEEVAGVQVASVRWSTFSELPADLVIPETVTSGQDGATYTVGAIAADGFANSQTLRSVTLPGTIKKIGDKAFSYDKGLESVDFSAATSLTTIPQSCFTGSSKLTGSNIALPASITTIEHSAFLNGPKLGSLDFLSNTSLTTIGDFALWDCGVTSIASLPATVEFIGYGAFYNNEITEFEIKPAMKEIGENALGRNKISYLKMEPANAYHPDLKIRFQAFAEQKCELTVEFDEACTAVPDYFEDCPFSQQIEYTIGDITYPTCLRVIVPINSVMAYRSHHIMGVVRATDYRVKFKWGTFTDQAALDADEATTLANRSYYNLYNITPQQRLIATSAWKNDILNFRPASLGSPAPMSFDSKPQTPDGRAGEPVIYKAFGEGLTFYANTVDYWNPATKTATPLPEEDGFFDGSAFAFNNETFDPTDEASYPKSLMPYTIHSYHANNGTDERLGRKPVEDGIVPFGTGVVIDFPKPGYYLVPPVIAQTAEEMSKYKGAYVVNADENNPVSHKSWQNIEDFPIMIWPDLRNYIEDVEGGVRKYKVYYIWGDMENFTRDNLDTYYADNYGMVMKTWSELFDVDPYLGVPILEVGGGWFDIDDRLEDVGMLVGKFNANHNPDTDHNVIIGLPDRYPIFPYWAASPYPWADAAHDDGNHPAVSERFEGDAADPLNFKYAQYGRMGYGYTASSAGNYGSFVSLREAESGTKTLDSDIQYVNFGISKGYFVQVKSEPGDASAKTSWTQPNRAYFSVSRAHMPHVFSDGSGEAKIALFLITDGEQGVTGIEDASPNGNGLADSDDWYTLDGRRLAGKPTQKGIYVHSGRKEVIQ